ncbi:type II toxin-antitoxin system RelE/ParE family toxin [Acidaminococcus sp.]|uniref:type II toxin-antitoxin system RelE/ParE family toxin n=1 Tax=Acidaminococcus sp. TaxID=1872103 RepID=UPI003D7ECB8B
MTEIRFMKPAAKFLKKCKDKRLKEKFHQALLQIAENPLLGEEKKGDLAGIRSCDIFYNKTNYELAYTIIIDNDDIIVVIMAGTRENFYEELKRYMKS